MSKLLLEDGSSALLLEDGSAILLEGAGSYTLALDAGSFAVAGSASSFSVARYINVTQVAAEAWYSGTSDLQVTAVYAEVWRATADAVGYTLSSGSGTFATTGQSARLLRAYVLPLGAGAFSLSGQSAGLGHTYALSCAAGAFTLAGQPATLFKSGHTAYSLTCSAGAFALTGQAASLFTIDPFFPDVVLLVGADGANASTSFVDESRYAHPLTANGNAQISNTNVSQGTGCILLDGTGDFVSTPNAAEFGIGGVFTIEASIRLAETTDFTVISLWGSTVANSCWALGSFGGVLTWKFYDSGGALRQITYPWTPTLGTYYDIAVSRDSAGKTRLRVNGVVVASNTNFGAPRWVAGASLFIGRQSGTSLYDLNGRIDELRITNTHDRYDTDATVVKPGKKFPRTGYTVVGAAGAFAFSGKAANLNVSRRLAASAGSFTLTGRNASLAYGVFGPGDFRITGGTASFKRGYRLPCAAGAFAFTFYPDKLLNGRSLRCATGHFTVFGKVLVIKRTYKLAMSNGAFLLAGQAARTWVARTLMLNSGALTLSAPDASLMFHRAPTFLLGKVRVYPALGGAGSIEPTLDGEPLVYPALDCAPKTNRWAA